MCVMSVVHSVQIYSEDAALVGRLCGIVSSALHSRSAVLIIATATHRDQLVAQLEKAGVDVRANARDGLFKMYDAGEMLATFMRNDQPDRLLFLNSVGNVLEEAKSKARGSEHTLTIFGEMVDVLWEKGQKEAAIRLEHLWNEVLSNQAFHLHCAYCSKGFINGDAEMLPHIHQAHSYVVQ